MSVERLFDMPGAASHRRLFLVNVAGTLLVALLGIGALYKLAEANQFSPRLWQPFLEFGLWRTVGEGLMATVRAAVWCILLSLIFGVTLALARLKGARPVSIAVSIWIEVNRSIPSLLVILLLYVTCSRIFGMVGASLDRNTWTWVSWLLGFKQLGTLGPLVVAVVLHHSAVVAEVVRSGILAVPKGQTDAGLSLGLSPARVLRHIVLPQALMGMMPALISECVRSLKATTLGYAIGYVELLRTGQIIAAALQNAIPVSIVMIAFFVAICLPLTLVAERIEARGRQRDRSAGSAARERDDLEPKAQVAPDTQTKAVHGVNA